MIWKTCELYIDSQTGVDELGNPIIEKSLIKSTVARFTPWTAAEIELEGREVTRDEQRFILPVPFSTLKYVTRAIIGEVEYEVVDKIDHSPRFSAVRVKAYKI